MPTATELPTVYSLVVRHQSDYSVHIATFSNPRIRNETIIRMAIAELTSEDASDWELELRDQLKTNHHSVLERTRLASEYLDEHVHSYQVWSCESPLHNRLPPNPWEV